MDERLKRNMDDLLGPDEVAAHFGVPRSTLYAWAYHGKGPKRLKIGRHTRYRRSDIEAYDESQIVDGES